MQARDILNEVGKMEESGMEQPWVRAVADTIVKAVEPLATKSDLQNLREELKVVDESIREDLKVVDESIREELKVVEEGIRKDLRAVEEGMRKELGAADEDIRKDMKAGFELLREQMKNQVLELKVWMLASQIILFGGLVATNIFL